MLTRRGFLFALTAGLLAGLSLFGAVAGAAGNQTKCPVLGGAINRDVYVDHQGQRIYFCCPSCIDEFKKDPDKYLKKMQEQGVVLDKTPTTN